MPTQLYIDMMMMIKNVYFCVAKTKADDPEGNFWIILLGTDCLEVLYGILHTMVGNDANLDLLQLSLRLTGTTKSQQFLQSTPTGIEHPNDSNSWHYQRRDLSFTSMLTTLTLHCGMGM